MMSAFVEGLVAGYGIAIPVGAVAILIVNTALGCGFRIGFMAGAGAATADVLYALLAALAGASLSRLLAPLAPPMRLVGGAALMGLAVWGMWKGNRPVAGDQPSAEPGRAFPTYVQFVGITLINPLTIVYFTAYILGRQAPAGGASLAESALFVFGAGLASLSWQTLLAGMGGFARRRLTPRVRVAAVVLGNLLVLGLGLRIIVQALIQAGA
ncbi:MAG: LysE family transporter [Anaerolineales bacterium]|nr:LysE family transporter [Anaerolineales bacterium]